MPSFVNAVGRVITIDPISSENLALIQVLRDGKWLELENLPSLQANETDETVSLKLRLVKKQFVPYPPFDELLRRYPDAQDVEELFVAAIETDGYEEFLLQDAEACMKYKQEKENANSNSSNSRSE